MEMRTLEPAFPFLIDLVLRNVQANHKFEPS